MIRKLLSILCALCILCACPLALAESDQEYGARSTRIPLKVWALQ